MFVAKDLTDSQRAVQASHACIEMARLMPDCLPHPHIVLIGLKPNKMERVASEIEDKGILVRRFVEPDL